LPRWLRPVTNAGVKHDPLKAVFMLSLATTCWGLSFPLMKGLVLAQQQLAPAASVWFITAQTLVIRFGLAAVVMAALFYRRMGPVRWLDIKLGLGLGFFAGVGTLFQMAALDQTPASVSAFLTQFTVLLVPLWLALVNRRRPSWLLVVCCALVIAGMAILCAVRWNNLQLQRGEWLTLLAAALFTGDILWLDRREFAAADKLRATAVMFATMAALLLPVALAGAPADGAGWRVYLTPGVFTMLLVLLGASTLVAFTIMNVWQPHIAPTHAALIYCAEPVFASLYALFLPGWLSRLGRFEFPNETLTARLWLGGALITLANILIQRDPRPAHAD
jgi:drug/metabolite transporter (DMT)-like permease